MEIDREKDAEKRKALAERKYNELDIEHKPQPVKDRWGRHIDRVERHHLGAEHRHGVGTSATQADVFLTAGRSADAGKPAVAKVRVAKLDQGTGRKSFGSAKAADDDFGAAVTPPTKVADAKPTGPGPKVGWPQSAIYGQPNRWSLPVKHLLELARRVSDDIGPINVEVLDRAVGGTQQGHA